MPRRSGVPKRDVLPDPMYNSKVITKLTNQVMQDGKKGTAQSIVYEAFDIVKEKTGAAPEEIFTQALENVKPVLEVKARRVSAVTSGNAEKKRRGRLLKEEGKNRIMPAYLIQAP